MNLQTLIQKLIDKGWFRKSCTKCGFPINSLADIIRNREANVLWFGEGKPASVSTPPFGRVIIKPAYQYHQQQLILLDTDEEVLNYYEENMV